MPWALEESSEDGSGSSSGSDSDVDIDSSEMGPPEGPGGSKPELCAECSAVAAPPKLRERKVSESDQRQVAAWAVNTSESESEQRQGGESGKTQTGHCWRLRESSELSSATSASSDSEEGGGCQQESGGPGIKILRSCRRWSATRLNFGRTCPPAFPAPPQFRHQLQHQCRRRSHRRPPRHHHRPVPQPLS